MATDDREEQIRQRAHALWEAEGRPDGKDLLHWDQASAEVGAPAQDEAEREAESAIEVISEAKERRSAKKSPGDGTG